jgi:L-fuculose-phosphate aldolase
MPNKMLNKILKQLAPNPGRFQLMPELSKQAELALLCRTLFREGYDDHIAGHISYRQADGSYLINPWELAWDEVTAKDVIRVDKTGKVIEGQWNVTPAISLHLAIHQQRDDVDVIIHNHSRYGTLWANMQRIPPIYDQTSAQVDGELVLYEEYDGTVNQADQAGKAAEGLGDAKWALLANHGVMVVAKDIRQAHLRAVTLEWRCKQAWHIEAAGGGVAMDKTEAQKLGSMIDGNGFPFLWEAMVRRELRSDPTLIESHPY